MLTLAIGFLLGLPVGAAIGLFLLFASGVGEGVAEREGE